MIDFSSPENMAILLERIEASTGIGMDSIPYYDEDIYRFLCGGDWKTCFMPGEFYMTLPEEAYGFSDLCRAVGIYSYFGELPYFLQDEIARTYGFCNRIPYCKEEYNEFLSLYGANTGNNNTQLCDEEFLIMFDYLRPVKKYILPRAEVHARAKQIAAMQWYSLNRFDEVMKCKLDMLAEQQKKNGSERDGFSFCCLTPEESGLETALWFDCSGKYGYSEPYYLVGDDLQTAEKANIQNACFCEDVRVNDYLKGVVMSHWNHEITDYCLLNCFIIYLKIQRKENEAEQ